MPQHGTTFHDGHVPITRRQECISVGIHAAVVVVRVIPGAGQKNWRVQGDGLIRKVVYGEIGLVWIFNLQAYAEARCPRDCIADFLIQ